MTPASIRILVVDDEPNLLETFDDILEDRGYLSSTAGSPEAALKLIKLEAFDIAFVDLKMPGMDGIELLRRIKAVSEGTEVIIMTAFGSIETAVRAIKEGAYDYLTKPFSPEDVTNIIRKVCELRSLRQEVSKLRGEIEGRFCFENLVGKSHSIQKIFDLIRTVGDADATVLIQGESGTGKELIARALHVNGPRKDKSFIAVNCSALADTLLESELFGHEKGAFTGAYQSRTGRLEAAHKGTVFLDEVGDMSPSLQAKVLRFIQERKFERVGSNKTLDVDVRITAATNRRLKEMIRNGQFREDLFYRLNVIHIEVPPLRERKGDIQLLVERFLGNFSRKNNRRIQSASDETMGILLDYDWPGNVRELENVVERAVIMEKGAVLHPSSLPKELLEKIGPQISPINLRDAEKRLIVEALDRADRDLKQSAVLLGISRTTLYSKLKKHKIPGRWAVEESDEN